MELRVTVPALAADAVSGLLMDLGSLGIHEEPDAAEVAGEVILHAYFDPPWAAAASRRLRRGWALLAAALGEPTPLRLSRHTVPEAGWAHGWKQHFRPLAVGRRLTVAPSWEAVPPEPGRLVVRIDPGIAFGTGHHASTRLCLEALEDHLSPPARPLRVLDVGTGTGILAIAAALLGAPEVRAIDLDPEAVAVAHENARLNRVADRVAVAQASLSELDGRWELIVANLQTQTLIDLAAPLAQRLAPGGLLLISGTTAPNAPRVQAALTDCGLHPRGQRAEPPPPGTGESAWVLLELCAPARETRA